MKYARYSDQILIHSMKFDHIQIQEHRVCICICIWKYKYVFDPALSMASVKAGHSISDDKTEGSAFSGKWLGASDMHYQIQETPLLQLYCMFNGSTLNIC